MAGVDTLVELNGSPVSNSSPQSPDGEPLLNTPLTLDFDPLSFEFKEPAALSPKSDAIPEMESPDQTDDSSSQLKSNRDGSDLDIFDPLSSSSDPRELHISSSVSSFELLTQVEQKAEYEMQMRKNDTVLSDIESKEESEQVSIDSLHNGQTAPDSLIDISTHENSPDLPESAVAPSPLPSETHDISKPDIVNDILVTEPEPDSELPQTFSNENLPCDLIVCDDNVVLENNIEQVTCELVTAVENVPAMAENAPIAENNLIGENSPTVDNVQTGIDGPDEPLLESNLALAEENEMHVDSAPDDVFEKHEDTFLTDSDADHSGANSSGGSSKGVNKKESSTKKKKTTKRKPISSTSSDSGKEDAQNKESKIVKSTATSAKTVSVEKKTTVEKEIKVEQQRTVVTQKSTKTSVITEASCNGVNGINGVDHRKYSLTSEDEEKEYHEDTEDGSVSVARLRSTYSSLSDHQDEITSPFKEYDAMTGVSLEDLKTQYENGMIHKEQLSSPTKEIINTGIDIKSLKSSYTHNATVERADISPTKEVFSTGVDIQSLKSTFNGHREVHKSKDIEVIETGISVKSLKTSFSSSQESVDGIKNQEQDGVKPSVDRAKVTRKFNQDAYPLYAMLDENDSTPKDEVCACKICGTHVYHMEKIKAEKSIFHKNCFRCKECGKALTVDSYDSNEGEIYCKLHFKTLFQPKARFDGDDPAPTSKPVSDESEGEEGRQRKHEVIIRENIPEELPPDVVRSDSKADDGLDFVPNLSNIRLRFESPQDENPHLPSIADRSALQRSESIVARMMKYQSAVSGERTENGDVSSSASEDEGDRDPDVVRETKQKEKVCFSGLSSLKSQWETGAVNSSNAKEDHGDEKKEVLTKLRQRICLGRSESMRAVYEKAIQESSTAKPIRSESVVLDKEINAGSIKEKFEKGEVVTEEVQEKLERARKEKEDDLSVFDAGITAEARTLFKQMEAASHQLPAANTPLSPCKSPICNQKSKAVHSFPPSTNETDVIKCSEPSTKEDIVVETVAVQEKFKFFENFKADTPKEKKRFEMTPPREPGKVEVSNEPEVPRDPNIVRACDAVEDIVITDTAKRMLDKFKALEKEVEQPPMPSGPKPLKRITPPREYTMANDHENSPEPQRDPDIVRASYKTEEEIVVEADKARSLKAKFENWQDEVVRENKKNEEEDYLPQADIAKNLRAKFEAIREETLKPVEKPKPKNETNGTNGEVCSICNKRLYPMEKMETSGFRLHKNCFRCAYCSSLLRLENYTTSGGKLYCTPHFKQLFITKGNYDEGFGREQHKEKWNRSCSSTPTSHDLKDEEINRCTNGNAHHGENGGYQEVLA